MQDKGEFLDGLFEYLAVDRPHPAEQLRDIYRLVQMVRNGVELADKGLNIPKQVEELERNLIAKALLRNPGNMSAAAEVLRITRQGLYKKMKRYGIRSYSA